MSLLQRVVDLEALVVKLSNQITRLQQEKLDKTGGEITGDVNVKGNLTAFRCKASVEMIVSKDGIEVIHLHREGQVIIHSGHSLFRARRFEVVDDNNNVVRNL